MIALFWMNTLPTMAQDSTDLIDKNGEYTGRGIAFATVAAAQVAEMRCGAKGWITVAIQKFEKLGVHIDLNEKQDYSDELYFATDILKKANKIGVSQWCVNTMPTLSKLVGEP